MSEPSDRGVRPPVSLSEDVEWLSESYPLGDGRYLHVSVYLVRAPGGTILIDSGSFYHRDSIQRRITEATRGTGIQSLVLSHSDYPHSGNISAFRRLWGDFEIVASSGDAAVQGLPYARQSQIGGSLDVLGRDLHFIDPPLADRSHTTWIYDVRSKVIFAADGMGSHHLLPDADRTSRDLVGGIRAQDIDTFHRDTLLWLRYVDPPRLMRTLRAMVTERPVEWIAPIHGTPIAAADLDDYMDKLEASVRAIAATPP